MRYLIVTLVLSAVAAPTRLFAGPLRPADVSAKARWLVHVDVQAIEASDELQKVYRDRVAKHPFVRSLREGRWRLKLDFEGELEGVTLYGTQRSQSQGVLLLYAESNDATGPIAWSDLPGMKQITYGAHQLYSWSLPDVENESLAIASPGTRLTVVAADVELLKSALDILDGQAPGLDELEDPPIAEPPANSMFLVWATGLGELEMSEELPLIERLQSFDYAEGMRNGRWFCAWTAMTDSTQTARHMKSLIDGIVAAYWLLYGAEDVGPPSESDAARGAPRPNQETEQEARAARMQVSVAGRQMRVRIAGPSAALSTQFSDFWRWMYTTQPPSK